MTDTPSPERLSLYYYPSCGFCRRVLRAIDELRLSERGVEIELRDIWAEPRWHDELFDARGRATVPVLRRQSDGEDHWMPESRDIINYLRSRFT
jgi:glutathione S-transferase